MKFTPLLFSFIFLLIFTACSDDETNLNTIRDCESIKNATILTEEEKQSTCVYNEVYRYNSEIYTLCVCCVCDKAALVIDCEENPFCHLSASCLEEFYQNAEYLFSVE